MLSRHHSLFLESLPAGCTRGYASCVHGKSSVSPHHALPRAAVFTSQHALPRAAGGMLVLQRRSTLPSARCAVRGRCSRTPRSGSLQQRVALTLKTVFGLWNSATAWSAEAFNATVSGCCSRYDLQHHCVVLDHCVSFARCFIFTCSADNMLVWSAELCRSKVS